ncbi:M28 family metallopeptidase [Simiduia aestuariiviva]|uniref:Peptidase M28 n=1 Tax=Simiduia aestuariiviva TaxID=1510459 RepID=A0A839UM81_9GAMM|nr:M28 family metallopeptidase [Simiduia aestuariiviva]MBB3167881.1 hypothetical protein [Simiduia aestuariiviva]
MKSILAIALFTSLLIANPLSAKTPKADPERIRAHLTFLADDYLLGRETGSASYEIAARYVASEMQQIGLKPMGDGGSYLQSVPFKQATLDQTSPVFEIIGPKGKEALTFLDDFAIGASVLEAESKVTAPLVFIGYGIEAEPLGHNDYANVDVQGKIVVVLSGKPASFPTEEGAHFNSEKRAAASRHGAVGMISLSSPESEKRFPFARNREYVHIPTMRWVTKAGTPAKTYPNLQNRAGVSIEAGKKLFANSGENLDSIFEKMAKGEPINAIDLKLSAHLAKKSIISDITSPNVVGYLPGSDKKLAAEYVVFSGHLDHIGVANGHHDHGDIDESGETGEKMDTIFNGAMDNASGIAIMLETARLFVQQRKAPKRSIIFLAVTGEEKGLLGSDYFAHNPTAPIENIVANINLDMPLLTFDFKNVVAFGAQHSSLKQTTERALKPLKLSLIDDPWPSQGIFTRSDHYMFVKQGVPSIFLATGQDSFNKEEDGAAAWADFLKHQYHQAGDDLDLPINYTAAARFAQVNYQIGLTVANDRRRPSWNKGNFFGQLFGKTE